jgi:hypothetical protein
MLRVNNLVGFGAGRLGKPVTFIGSNTDEGNSSSYTFTDEPIGDASADRLVIFGIGGVRNNSGNATCTGITFGGSGGTLITSSGARQVAAIGYLLITSGTTSTIVASFDQTMRSVVYFVCHITELDSNTANDTGFDTDAAGALLTTTLDVPSNGVTIGMLSCAGGGTVDWVGTGNRFTETDLAENADNHIAASNGLTANATHVLSGDHSSPNLVAMAAGSWG